MATIDQMLELADNLRDDKDLTNTIGVLNKILVDYANDAKIDRAYLMLGAAYKGLGQYHKSLDHYKKSAELNPTSEVASLGLFLIYMQVGLEEEADEELVRYLNRSPANIYKSVLEGLIEQIQNGYATKYKDDIFRLAKVNGVKVR